MGGAPSREDYPEPLAWEAELWRWYLTLASQVRPAPDGSHAIDLTVWLPVIQQQGWDMECAFSLLKRIEAARFGPSPSSSPERPADGTVH